MFHTWQIDGVSDLDRAALSGPIPKAPGFAGGYLPYCVPRCQLPSRVSILVTADPLLPTGLDSSILVRKNLIRSAAPTVFASRLLGLFDYGGESSSGRRNPASMVVKTIVKSMIVARLSRADHEYARHVRKHIIWSISSTAATPFPLDHLQPQK